MTSTQPERLETKSGAARRLLTMIVGLLASLALIVSGATPASAQNAVGPQPQSLILAVGVQAAPAPNNVGPDALPLRQQASATGVAADTAADELPGLTASRSQLEAKFKHAADFGVTDSRGAAGFDAYGKAVDSFVNDSSTVRVAGTYRGNAAILNYNATSRLVVVQGTDGSFVSGWQMSQAQLQNVMTRGSLGGG